jgi:hypothetical protein
VIIDNGSAEDLSMTAVDTLERHESGYTALAMHKDAPGRRKHEVMVCHAGRGKALDQLVDIAKHM